MTSPGGTQVTPGELITVVERLTSAAREINDSFVSSTDLRITSPELTREVMFGPATDVADRYVALANQLPGYVQAVTSRLAEGAEVFIAAAVGFTEIEARNKVRMAPR